MKQFWIKQALWSQATFGNDSIRGPIGPALHLLKEAREVIHELTYGNNQPRKVEHISFREVLEELVDCQHLIFDAARRAGFTYEQFLAACFKKLEENMKRKWSVPSTDKPVEHER